MFLIFCLYAAYFVVIIWSRDGPVLLLTFVRNDYFMIRQRIGNELRWDYGRHLYRISLDFIRKYQNLSEIFAYMQNLLYLCSRFWSSMRAIVLAIGVLGVAMVLLCVGVILRKDHAFRSQHIGDNERMKADNIHCAAAQDRQERKRSELKIKN